MQLPVSRSDRKSRLAKFYSLQQDSNLIHLEFQLSNLEG